MFFTAGKIKLNNSTRQITPPKIDWNRPFSREELQIANRQMKRCSIKRLIDIREMNLKTAMRHQLTPVKRGVIENK